MILIMRPLLLIALLTLFLTPLTAQQTNPVIIGAIDTLHSQILNEQRIIWVHVPESARNAAQTKKKYPVVYLLDGDKNFTSVVGIIDLLSSVNGNDFWPEMIVVGILNTDRRRDLTPTHVTGGLWVDSAFARSSGGGEAFMSFIEKELIPRIDSLYPTIPYRMLIGHSLGGLTVINSLVHNNKMFNSYVAIDPSMWWDQQRLLHEAGRALSSAPFAGKALFLAMAQTQPPGMDTVMIQQDTTESTLHPRSILQLSRHVMGNPKNGLQADFKYYEGETHVSVPLIATYDALHFIFREYPLTFQNSYFADPTFKLALFLKAHYDNVGLKYCFTAEDGRPLAPPEDLVNNLGFFVLGKKQFQKAEDMFTMNIKNYPSGFVTYGYLGDLYAAKGDKEKAITSYKKSLSLKEREEVRKKLEKLEKLEGK